MATPLAKSWPRPSADARRTDLALLLLTAATLGCSQAAPPGEPVRPVQAPAEKEAAAPLSGADLAGYWKWSLVSEEDGIRRVEVETWHFSAVSDNTAEPAAERQAPEPSAPEQHTIDAQSRAADPATPPPLLRGTCERTVTFMSLDGTPFSCNQDLHYRLTARYQVEVGRSPDGGVTVAETDYRVEPALCERGYRRLTAYRAQLADGEHLRLRWANGQQVLRRIQAPVSAGAVASTSEAQVAANTDRSPLTGTWQWHSHNRRDGEVRVESETWNLREEPASGALTGTYERTVTVFEERGARYSCSGETFYRYRDQYRVRGARTGTQVNISEIAATPEKHPCLDHHERHLDAAIGRAVGSYLELTWRGGKRQVLRRAPASP